MDQQIQSLCKRLKLPGVFSTYESVTREAIEKKITYPEYLIQILKAEEEARDEKGKQKRILLARFPTIKRFEQIELDKLPKDAQDNLQRFKNLDFLRNNQNLIMVGNSGTGKTLLAISIGVKACEMGYHVLFKTAAGLINELKEAKSDRSLTRFAKTFGKLDLVVLDELGYISFDLEGAGLLFQYIALRYEVKSTIITSNLVFSEWIKIFKDQALTMALLDRITQNAIILNMNGRSYRRKELDE